MKKLLLGGLVLAFAVAMAIPSAVFAEDPVEVNMNWAGTSGAVGYEQTSGDDAYVNFSTVGSAYSGHFASQYVENTAYPYMGVNTFQSYLNASVTNGGITYWTDRTDSYGSYGAAGQTSYSQLLASGGTGEMAMGSWTNFASQKDCLYSSTGTKLGVPVRTSGGHHFEADATNYFMVHDITAPDGDWAYVTASGSGIADLDCMSNELGASSLRLGWGCGCYTDADFYASGSGSFEAYGQGTNSVSSAYGTVTGAGAWQSNAMGWNGGTCTVPDYSMTVD